MIALICPDPSLGVRVFAALYVAGDAAPVSAQPYLAVVEGPPDEWWATFDRALAHALDQGWSPLRAEDYARARAEDEHGPMPRG